MRESSLPVSDVGSPLLAARHFGGDNRWSREPGRSTRCRPPCQRRSRNPFAALRYALDVGRTLEQLEAYEGIAILATNRKENIDDAFRRRLRYVVDFSVG